MSAKTELDALDCILATEEQSEDSDIYSQLNYIKESLIQLHYLAFKLFCHEQDDQLNQSIQNAYIEIAIKLRHLLDQAFGRFVKRKIHQPNGFYLSDVHFTATDSLADLNKVLAEAKIVGNMRGVSLDTHYPEVYRQLVASQPFSPGNSHLNISSWIELLIIISNQAKHESLSLPTDTQLDTWWNLPDLRPTSLFPLFYSEKSIEPWSFSRLLNGNLALSTELHDELRRKQFIREKSLHPKIEEYVIAIHRGQRADKTILINMLKDSIEFITKHGYTSNLAVLDGILNVLLNQAEKKLGYTQRFSEGAVVDIATLLRLTVIRTTPLFAALLDRPAPAFVQAAAPAQASAPGPQPLQPIHANIPAPASLSLFSPASSANTAQSTSQNTNPLTSKKK